MSKHSTVFWTCLAALAAACSADVAMGPHAVPGSPRFASGQLDPQAWTSGCRTGDTLRLIGPSDPLAQYDKNGDMAVCLSDKAVYDNKLGTGGGNGGDNGGGWVDGCKAGDTLRLIGPSDPLGQYDKNGDMAVCLSDKGVYDNKLANGGGNDGGNGGGWVDGCKAGDTLRLIGFGDPLQQYDENGDLAVCLSSSGVYDNRLK